MRIMPIALAAAVSLAAVAAEGATLTYDFRSGSSTSSTNSGSGYGNIRTFTVGGVTVTVTAWSLTGAGSTFETSQLGRFDSGLGACNRVEQTGCSDPNHQVDNVGADDFVLFQFSALVDPTTITIDPSGDYDRDVSYWVGTAGMPLNLTGLSLASLGGLGFGARFDDDASSSSSARSVAIGGGLVNSILFGASCCSGDQDDYFKIRSMVVEYTPTTVPEPAGLALFGAALAGLGLARRRRTN